MCRGWGDRLTLLVIWPPRTLAGSSAGMAWSAHGRACSAAALRPTCFTATKRACPTLTSSTLAHCPQAHLLHCSEGISSEHGAQQTWFDPLAPDYQRFPRAREATPYVAVCGPGDTILVPGDWFHYAVCARHRLWSPGRLVDGVGGWHHRRWTWRPQRCW